MLKKVNQILSQRSLTTKHDSYSFRDISSIFFTVLSLHPLA